MDTNRILRGVVAFVLSCGAASAQWPELHGPDSDRFSDRSLPQKWDEESHVSWKVPIEGRGWSTPLVDQREQVWITTAHPEGYWMDVIVVDGKSGDQLLRRRLRTTDNPEILNNEVNTYASCTGAIVDGRAYLHFGSYGTFCLDTETYAEIWRRTDLPASHWRGPASSVIEGEGGTILLTFDAADLQYTACLDQLTGATRWITHRSTDFGDIEEETGFPTNAGDFRKAYITPLLVSVGETRQLISVGSKGAQSYDPVSGAEIWSLAFKEFTPSSRPVYDPVNERVLINTGLGKPIIHAVDLSPKLKGAVTEEDIAWSVFQRTPRRSTPVLHGGVLYFAEGGVLSAIDAQSGEKLWAERIGGTYSASLLATPEAVYAFSEEGETTVFAPSREAFQELSKNTLEAGFMASPAVLGDSLILRTKEALYRIGE